MRDICTLQEQAWLVATQGNGPMTMPNDREDAVSTLRERLMALEAAEKYDRTDEEYAQALGDLAAHILAHAEMEDIKLDQRVTDHIEENT